MQTNRETPYTIELDKRELEQLILLAKQLVISPSDKPDSFCQLAKELSLQIPDRIKYILKQFKEKGTKNGFLLIKNINLSEKELPLTPSGNNEKVGEKTVLARIQAILISVIGEMIAYEAEGYGRLFQDVVPMKNMESVQTSVGSNTELEIHTEQAFSKLRPDILSLACLRGDENAITYILPVTKIIENCSENDIQLLYKALWKTGVDLSFKLNGYEFIDGDIRGPLAILNANSELSGPFLIFDQDLMTGLTAESQQMVQKMVEIYYQHRIAHKLQPGEIIFIDNNRAVHGRSPFFPKYDGLDRFLVRCFATYHFEKSDYARPNGGRMIAAIYS
jgi:L-asparagine oxygenase